MRPGMTIQAGSIRSAVARWLKSNGFSICLLLALLFSPVFVHAQSNTPCPAPPMLPVNASCVNSNGTNGAGFSQSGVLPAPSCGNFGTVRDAWYRFTAPASGVVNIQTTAGGLTDGAMAVYAAPACTGPFTEIGCDDDSGPGLMPQLFLTGLVPGQVYYIRIWRALIGANGTFQICITTPVVPLADCYYVLSMLDDFGDGWDGSTVGISLNGGPFTNYTVTAGFNYALIPVTGSAVLVVRFTNLSAFPDDIRYEISLDGLNIFAAGPNPATGIVFTTTLDCQTPPQAQQDCLGGNTVCGGQAFNNNSSSTGNFLDLNAGNQGCLGSGEQQGTWYLFSPATAGTVGFTIAPSVVTDYDFAVWGPYPPGSTVTTICPPATAPLRCSYAAPSGNTGAGNGATDPSEGVGGDRWVSVIPVLADQVYLLYIDNFSTNGQSFNLTWQLGGGASLDCTVLPIELLRFNARAVDDQVELEWTTASEKDNDHFDIERSTDGLEFAPIGSMAGAGNSTSEQHYVFSDQQPSQGINHYRLRQVDTDGHEDVSDVRTVVFHGDPVAMQLYPNPGQGAFVIRSTAPTATRYALVDAQGRRLREGVLTGPSTEVLASDLARGAYMVQLYDEHGVVVDRSRWLNK